MVVCRYNSVKAPSGYNGFDKPDIVSPEADLRKRALSAAYGGALEWRKFSILVDPQQISVVSKGEKQKNKKQNKTKKKKN